MMAITLWQPWASLIAVGAKTVETRRWAPTGMLRGQRIAIHAGKRVVLPHDMTPALRRAVEEALGVGWEGEIPTGAVVATATLVGWEPTWRMLPDVFGDYSAGRFGWTLADVEPIDPPARARGRQGFWTWEPS